MMKSKLDAANIRACTTIDIVAELQIQRDHTIHLCILFVKNALTRCILELKLD